MPGRKAVAVAALVSAAAFGGGAALGATHGSSQPVVKKPPARHTQLHKQLPRSVHYGCHHDHGSGAAQAAAFNL
jgi:hypothetical protein